ncbi:hypothetical protein QJS10_CPA03g02277 [Acorus calamus]|uniref:KIB1-4 beta-propeller domain-containing protein n=1 Tax=Acorus calamus TaxID=4465 RepID=A0AAV9F5W9_ACOCL|nr:hypothetical protein QJS10_CPA03g02277 [Acorus calamus]
MRFRTLGKKCSLMSFNNSSPAGEDDDHHHHNHHHEQQPLLLLLNLWEPEGMAPLFIHPKGGGAKAMVAGQVAMRPEFNEECFWRCSYHGWLIMDIHQTITLVNPFFPDIPRIDLPFHLPNTTNPSFVQLDTIILSAPPTTVGCLVLAISVGGIYLCKPGDETWRLLGTVNTEGVRRWFEAGVWYEGKFYAFGSDGSLLVVDPLLPLEEEDRMITLHQLEVPNGIVLTSSSLAHGVSVRPFLVEEGGVMMAALKTAENMSPYELRNVDVLRLDLPNARWVKVDDIGSDRVLYLGGNGHTGPAEFRRIGSSCCKGNRVYVAGWDEDIAWYVFNMEDKSVEEGPQVDGLPHGGSYLSTCWVTPPLSFNCR